MNAVVMVKWMYEGKELQQENVGAWDVARGV